MNEWNCDGCHFKMDTKELEELEAKLTSIEHHFKHHDRMYVFDFNMLMDEAVQSSSRRAKT